jgi:predicted enzyme related to lactoylglutathione lyase
VMMPPRDFPGGRFAILLDPQGASFGILRMAG